MGHGAYYAGAGKAVAGMVSGLLYMFKSQQKIQTGKLDHLLKSNTVKKIYLLFGLIYGAFMGIAFMLDTWYINIFT